MVLACKLLGISAVSGVDLRPLSSPHHIFDSLDIEVSGVVCIVKHEEAEWEGLVMCRC
jgi:hypothetical protein